MPEQISVLIVDDHNLFRYGIKALLKKYKNIKIVGDASSGQELIDMYFRHKPDVVLADISMPEMTGPEAISKIRKQDEEIKTLFLSMHEGKEVVKHVLKAGGKGLLNKKVNEDELVEAILTIADGKYYFGEAWTEEKINNLLEDFSLDNLSGEKRKEAEILKFLKMGIEDEKIAELLKVNVNIIRMIREKIFEKPGNYKLGL